jgi:hypothetical protein
MAGLDQVPMEARWRIAGRSLSSLAVRYDTSFENEIGEKYGRIVSDIWEDIGRDAGAIARAFGMPVGNAQNLASALGTFQALLNGPECCSRVIAGVDDSAVCHITGCAMLARAREMDVEPHRACASCRSYAPSVIKHLNPEYMLFHRKRMCHGDSHCELLIRRRERARTSP